jgi:phospholipid transport system substrate-binding protein
MWQERKRQARRKAGRKADGRLAAKTQQGFNHALCILFACLSPGRGSAAAGGKPAANQVVQNLVDDLPRRWKRAATNRARTARRCSRRSTASLPHFDIDYASLLVLGQNARTATVEQRARFAKAMYNSITHATRKGC